MIPLQFPLYEFRVRETSAGRAIWDQWRKKWVALTPEEWVRQNLGRYLVHEKYFPAGRIAVEKSLVLHAMKRRADMVVYSDRGIPVFLAECKAPDVRLSQAVADQAAAYNLVLGVPYILITNGLSHFCCHHGPGEERWKWLDKIPEYGELTM